MPRLFNKKKNHQTTVPKATVPSFDPPSKNRPKPDRKTDPDTIDFHLEMVNKIDSIINQNTPHTTNTNQPTAPHQHYNKHIQPSQTEFSTPPNSNTVPQEFNCTMPPGEEPEFRFIDSLSQADSFITPFANNERVEIVDLNTVMKNEEQPVAGAAMKMPKIHVGNPNKPSTPINTAPKTTQKTPCTPQEDIINTKEVQMQKKQVEKEKRRIEREKRMKMKAEQRKQQKDTQKKEKKGFTLFSKKENTTTTKSNSFFLRDTKAKPTDNANSPVPETPQKTVEYTQSKNLTPTTTEPTHTPQPTNSYNPTEIPIEQTTTNLITDEEVIQVLLMTDELLGNLPQQVIANFAQSPDFKIYEKVMNKVKNTP